MSIPLPVILIFGAALCAWALLRCIGNECDRRLRALEERVRAEEAVKAALAAAREAATPSEPMVATSLPSIRPGSAAKTKGQGKQTAPARA